MSFPVQPAVGRQVSDAAEAARILTRSLSRYREANTSRAVFELCATAIPLAAVWVAMWGALRLDQVWLYVLLIVPAGGLLVRMFMIQHDCGHGAFFRSRKVNDWIGRIIGVLTMTPYGYWRRAHAVHHASAGNLDGRGIGDITTFTVSEYRALSPRRQLLYRLYRHPMVMFGFGSFYLFFVQNRVPASLMRAGWQPWISTMTTNAALFLLAGAFIWMVGLVTFLLLFVPVGAVAAAMGVWLFYVQHQFEETHWAQGKDWSALEAALHGSSHYDLPPVLRWFTANIGVHHVHHLASRIPFYRLPEVIRDFPELKEVGRLTLGQSFRSVRLVLWDEASQRLVSFRDALRSMARDDAENHWYASRA